MSDTDQVPALEPCPICVHKGAPMWWLCQRVTQRDGIPTYALIGCDHIPDVVEWAAPPNGFSRDRKLLADAWNAWTVEAKKEREERLLAMKTAST